MTHPEKSDPTPVDAPSSGANPGPTEATDSAYAMGYTEEFLGMLTRRNAPRVAGHLLPRLKPGMRVLDIGCGPGTISVGLADAVAPGGELHGVDIEDGQIGIATAAARAGGHHNAHFRVASATDLPFDAGTFDAAHGHAVLMHVPELGKALSEVRRVLKPGGILASRELIASSNWFDPDPGGNLDQATKLFADLLAANGGSPDLGKQLKRHLREAGFVDPVATASFEVFADESDRTFFEGFVRGWFLSPGMKGPAIRLGLATEADFEAWEGALGEWRSHPGGAAAFAWGECVALSP